MIVAVSAMFLQRKVPVVMRNYVRLTSIFLLLVALVAPITSPATSLAQTNACGDVEFGISSYRVEDNGDSLRSDTAYYRFRPTESEIAALECGGPQLLIAFRFIAYETRDGVTGYEFDSTNLQVSAGQLERVAYDEVVLWTAINVDELVAGRRHDISVRFWGFYALDTYDRDHFLYLESGVGEWYEESYVGECDDDLTHTINTDKGTYCRYLYDNLVRLGKHEFVYTR